MSLKTKRNLSDLTNENNKHFKNDSIIDFNFNIGEFKNDKKQISLLSESLIDHDDDDDSIFNDDVLQDEQRNSITYLSKTTNQHQTRKRLNGTSTYKHKYQRKSLKKENHFIDQTLNQLREEQARIDAHSLSINIKYQ